MVRCRRKIVILGEERRTRMIVIIVVIVVAIPVLIVRIINWLIMMFVLRVALAILSEETSVAVNSLIEQVIILVFKQPDHDDHEESIEAKINS
jgi:hypothetical protein